MSSSAQSLLERLLTVEVDVVVTQRVVHASVGDDPSAMVAALIADYREWIVDHAAVLDADWTALRSSDGGRLALARMGERLGLVEHGRAIDRLDLDRLHAVATASPIDGLIELERVADVAVAMCTVVTAAGRLSDPHVAAVLRRIGGNAAQMQSMLAAGTPTPGDLAMLRKALELRTDVILAQTVVQADGDVVVRVDPAVASGELSAVAGIADVAMDRTVGFWGGLIDLIGVVATSAGALRTSVGRLVAKLRAGVARWRSRRSAATERLGARQTWTLLRETGADLFGRGGAAIESRSDGSVPYARTVVQPDGDALWLIQSDALGRQDLLDEHVARVAEWYGTTGLAVSSARAYLARLQGAASVAIGVVSATATAAAVGWWALALGSAAAAAAPRLVRSAVGRVIRRHFRVGAW